MSARLETNRRQGDDRVSKNDKDTFTFKVPKDAVNADGTPHADVGKEVEKSFDFTTLETDEEVLEYLTSEKTSVIKLVNDKIKANARSAAYQAALLVYKPSKLSKDEIAERIIRDYIRMGLSEEAARAQVAGMMAAL